MGFFAIVLVKEAARVDVMLGDIHSSTSKQVATKSGFDFDTVLWMVGFEFQACVVWINNVGFDAAPRTVFRVSLSPCIPGPPSGFDVVVLKV